MKRREFLTGGAATLAFSLPASLSAQPKEDYTRQNPATDYIFDRRAEWHLRKFKSDVPHVECLDLRAAADYFYENGKPIFRLRLFGKKAIDGKEIELGEALADPTTKLEKMHEDFSRGFMNILKDRDLLDRCGIGVS